MDILTLYVSLLNAAHMSADEDGVVHRQIKGMEDKKTPVLVTLADDKRATMVLPIKKQTDIPDWSNRVVFHPLRENTQRGESLVMEKYRTNMLARVNSATLVLMVTMLQLAGDTSQQTNMTPDQLSYLAKLPDANATALANFNELAVKCAVTDKPTWAYIKSNGIKNGTIYRRLCTVGAPMLEAILAASDRKVKGVKLRIADVALYKTMYSLVFPMIKFDKKADGQESVNFDFYSHGSNSVRAPTMDAFMGTIKLMVENINNLAMLFDSAVAGLMDNLMMDMAWAETFENIDNYGPKILLIPAMPGNEGRVLNERAEVSQNATPPWEPATAPPSGFNGDITEAVKVASEAVREAVSDRRESRYPDTRREQPAGNYGRSRSNDDIKDNDAVKKSAFHQMLEREQERGGRVAMRGREEYSRRDDPATANGYPPPQSYDRRAQYDRRDSRDRGYGGRSNYR